FVMCALFIGSGGVHRSTTTGLTEPLAPTFTSNVTIDVQTAVVVQVKEHTWLTADGQVDNLPPGTGSVFWPPGEHTIAAGTKLYFFQGSSVPVVVGEPADNASWL